MRENVSVVALIEIRAEDISRVKDELKTETYVRAFYELMGRYNIGIIAEVENEEILFDIVLEEIRKIPGVEETKTHIMDGMVI